MNPSVSIIINADTRPPREEASSMFNGACSSDFILSGVKNKIKFFDGFDFEVILFVDEHQKIDPVTLSILHDMCDKLVISRHNKAYRGSDPFSGFNDINYLHALSLAKEEYIAHFDQDIAAFARNKFHVEQLVAPVVNGDVKYVCYPTEASPKCVDDPSFGDHAWASTRFFFTRKETINLTELEAAIWEPQTLYAKHGTPNRQCPWTEHFLGQMCGNSVLYPPLSNDLLIFAWSSYKSGVLEKLNALPFDEINMKLIAAGAHSYHGVAAERLIL